MPGGPGETPRWQQAYGADNHYTGRTNSALPVPPALEPLRAWALEHIDPRLNGLLHQLVRGARPLHRSAPRQHAGHDRRHTDRHHLVRRDPGVLAHPRHGEAKETRDFEATNGAVFVLPYDTNLV